MNFEDLVMINRTISTNNYFNQINILKNTFFHSTPSRLGLCDYSKGETKRKESNIMNYPFKIV